MEVKQVLSQAGDTTPDDLYSNGELATYSVLAETVTTLNVVLEVKFGDTWRVIGSALTTATIATQAISKGVRVRLRLSAVSGAGTVTVGLQA